MSEEAVYIDESGPDLRLSVSGHMTAQLCPSLKSAFMARLPRIFDGRVRIDLSACEYMDSSFLGLLVQFSKAATATGLSKPVLHGVGNICRELLETMGMTRLFEYSDSPCALASPRMIESASAGGIGASFLLETHRELEILSPENRARFRDLTAMLERESENEDSPE